MSRLADRDPPRMGFAASRLVRGAEERGPDTLARALADSRARLHLRSASGWLLQRDGAAASGTEHGVAEATTLGANLEEAILLGWTKEGAPHLAAALHEGGTGEHPVLDLRAAGMALSLEAGAENELAQAQHLLNWHARTRFCGVCGAPTRPAQAGYRRDCTRCEAVFFPRTDPVAIMFVRAPDGAALLGRQRHFGPGMYSCLAGFVEPGETIEDAVRREVAEEVGIAVGPVAYEASQPWPFPGSLMIGCSAEAAERGAIAVQESELEDARWFEPAELSLMLAGTHPDALTLPPPYAIAHHLVRRAVERDQAMVSE